MKLARILTLALAIPMLASTTAFAATAPTLTVGAPSLRASKPTFSWMVGADGATYSKVYVASSQATNAETGAFTGRLLATLNVAPGATTATVRRPMFAGRYFANGMWSATDGTMGYSSPIAVTIPPSASFIGGLEVDQPRSGGRASISGTVRSNMRQAVPTCTVFHGSEEVDSSTGMSATTGVANQPRSFDCTVRVNRDLGGETLRVVIKFMVGARAVTKATTFVAEGGRPGSDDDRPSRPGRPER